MRYYVSIILFILLICFYGVINAQDNFSSSGVSLLYGCTFKVPILEDSSDKKRAIITLDTLNKRTWGDAFGFIDIGQSLENNKAETIYGEFIPRFYLPESLQIHTGLIDKILLAPSLEFGASANGFTQVNYLIGLGTNLKIPYFKVFQLNFFRRNNQRMSGNWQLTPIWLLPLQINRYHFIFSGWLDYMTATHEKPASVQSQSQYLLDMGELVFHKKNTFLIGSELLIWHNKFFIKGVNETVIQAMIMFRF